MALARLTTHDSRLTTHDSRLTTHDSKKEPTWTLCFARGTSFQSFECAHAHLQKETHVPKMHHSRWSDDHQRTDRIRQENGRKPWTGNTPKAARRLDGSEEFKCRKCRSFVGPTISGGKHRNHCPQCLHSRHVDRSSPGDRKSDCRSIMPAIGTFF